MPSEFGFQSNLLICLIAAESSGSNEFIIFLKISKYIFLRINNLWRHYLLLKGGCNIRDPIFIANIRKIGMKVRKNFSSLCTPLYTRKIKATRSSIRSRFFLFFSNFYMEKLKKCRNMRKMSIYACKYAKYEFIDKIVKICKNMRDKISIFRLPIIQFENLSRSAYV